MVSLGFVLFFFAQILFVYTLLFFVCRLRESAHVHLNITKTAKLSISVPFFFFETFQFLLKMMIIFTFILTTIFIIIIILLFSPSAYNRVFGLLVPFKTRLKTL